MKEKIQDEFDEAVGIRKELNSVHWKEYERLSTVFAVLFNESKSTLKFISDLNYYQGGYPSETSPPRINSIFEKVGTAARFYDVRGKLDEINLILSSHGFELVRTNPDTSIVTMSDKRIDDDKKAIKAYEELGMVDSDVQGMPDQVIEKFLERTMELQRTICQMADSIKIDLFEQANVKLPEIGKSGFVSAVNSVASKQLKESRKKDTNPLVTRVLEKVETLQADAALIEETIKEGM